MCVRSLSQRKWLHQNILWLVSYLEWFTFVYIFFILTSFGFFYSKLIFDDSLSIYHSQLPTRPFWTNNFFVWQIVLIWCYDLRLPKFTIAKWEFIIQILLLHNALVLALNLRVFAFKSPKLIIMFDFCFIWLEL